MRQGPGGRLGGAVAAATRGRADVASGGGVRLCAPVLEESAKAPNDWVLVEFAYQVQTGREDWAACVKLAAALTDMVDGAQPKLIYSNYLYESGRKARDVEAMSEAVLVTLRFDAKLYMFLKTFTVLEAALGQTGELQVAELFYLRAAEIARQRALDAEHDKAAVSLLLMRTAQFYRYNMKDIEAASNAYRAVLDINPNQEQARGFLSDVDAGASPRVLTTFEGAPAADEPS